MLLISSELPEVLALSQRILVMRQGAVRRRGRARRGDAGETAPTHGGVRHRIGGVI